MQDDFPHYIEFRHVFKTFDRPVLVDCSFYLDPGKTLAVIGRSGVGKSVCLQHIMGFLKPDSGRIVVANQDITDLDEAHLRPIRRKVTMVFQSGALFDSLTVGENILFSLELHPEYNYANRIEVVRGLLGMVDLADYEDAYPADLSTGYHLGNLMLRLKKQLGLTSVVVTHDLDLMRKVADTVAFLDRGQVAYFGPVSGLEQSKHPGVQAFLRMDRLDFSAEILRAVD